MTDVVRQTGYIRDAWLVILLGLVFGGGLAGVQGALSAKIAENKRQETYSVIPELVSGADAAKTVELLLEGQNGREARVYKVAASDGTHRGWVLPADGQGFADRVEVLIGLDAGVSTITGLYVLEQKETPGLGDYITGESFRKRFRGKPTDMPVVVVKGDPKAENEIRALTGATISSESVAAIVNEAVANMKEAILKDAGSSYERK
jgi:electron transport complex protein RnfG